MAARYAEDHPTSTTNKFPWKLWRIVNGCQTDAIRWNDSGKTIIIHKQRFQEQFLDPPHNVFKTTNIGSFIRQLNLYGFRKVQPACRHYSSDTRSGHMHDDPDRQEFHNESFHRDRPELVQELRRHVGVRKAKEQAGKQRRFYDSFDNHKVKVRKSNYMMQDENIPVQDHRYKLQKPPGSAPGYTRPVPQGGFPFQPLNGENFTSFQAILETKKTTMVAFPIFDESKPFNGQHPPPLLMEWSHIHKKWISATPPTNFHHGFDRFNAGFVGTDGNPLCKLTKEEFDNLVGAVTDAMKTETPPNMANPLMDIEDPSNYAYHYNPHDQSPFMPVVKHDFEDEAGLSSTLSTSRGSSDRTNHSPFSTGTGPIELFRDDTLFADVTLEGADHEYHHYGANAMYDSAYNL